jgi:hypothetical protein
MQSWEEWFRERRGIIVAEFGLPEKGRERSDKTGALL